MTVKFSETPVTGNHLLMYFMMMIKDMNVDQSNVLGDFIWGLIRVKFMKGYKYILNDLYKIQYKKLYT